MESLEKRLKASNEAKASLSKDKKSMAVKAARAEGMAKISHEAKSAVMILAELKRTSGTRFYRAASSGNCRCACEMLSLNTTIASPRFSREFAQRKT